MTFPQVVLASSSAIRFKLLKNAGVDVARQPAGFDENIMKDKAALEGWPAKRLALQLAEAKARSLGDDKGKLIIGADQVLLCEGRLFNKPENQGEAREQLQALSGKTHHLISAVAITQNTATVFSHVEQVDMTLRDLDDDEIDTYLEKMGDEVLETVGGYKLEALGAQLMEKIEGDYFSVLGLPLLPVLGFLRQSGVVL